MKQLSGLDVSFLNLEDGRAFGHVSSLGLFEPPEDPNFSAYESYRSLMLSKIGDLDPYRRRLVEVPFGLDRPYWIDDPAFDIDFHIRHIAVPPPGGDEQLADLVGRLIGRPMDRSRPLWESYVIEGLESGEFAVLAKMHHATIDGAAGAEMMMVLFDREPDAPLEAGKSWQPGELPTDSALMSKTAIELTRRPIKAVRLQVRLLRDLGRATQNPAFDSVANQIRRGIPGPAGAVVGRLLGATDEQPEDLDEPSAAPSILAPRTPFNATISPHRRFAHRSTPLQQIKDIKNALGATLNDVVMAICAGGLRRYLESVDALPEEDLRAMVPVSIRTGDETEKWTNRVSTIFSALPTSESDPLKRVAAVHEAMALAKEQFNLIPADTLVELSDLAPPALAIRASRVAARARLADRTNPAANLVISNVPGPREPLYMHGGAKLKRYYPVSMVVDGQGLNITVQSYVDGLDFGLVSCRELVPDLWKVMDYLFEEIDILAEAAGVQTSTNKANKKKADKAKAGDKK
nr:putative wax ester synthase/acyl-CoA:diacylglycerol acyltransferase [uncultured bacterium]